MNITQLQQQASEYLAQGQYDAAISLYEQCIEANPNRISTYWHLGLALLLQGEELEAQSIWLSVLGQGTPEEVDSWMRELALVLEAEAIRHVQMGNLQQAERIYWQIIELVPNYSQAYYNLGTVLVNLEKLDEAVACLQRAIESQPDFADAYYNLGHAFLKQKNFVEAMPCYLKARSIAPDCRDTHYELGMCFAQKENLDEAIACFQSCIQLNPDDTEAYFNWGEALLKQGKLDEAIACFKQVFQVNPEFVQAYCNWRDTQAKQGQFNDALNSNASLLQALQTQQHTPEFYLRIVEKIAIKNDFRGFIEVYKNILKIKPDYEKGYLNLGAALAIDNQTEAAIASYKKAIEIKPDYLEGYLKLGEVLAKFNRIEVAIRFYKNALEIKTDYADIYLNLGLLYAQKDNHDEASACFQKAVDIEPNYAEGYLNLGVAQAQKNQTNEAIVYLQKALEIKPTLTNARYNLGVALQKNGNQDEANACFHSCLPLNPPQGLYESTRDWAVMSGLDKDNYIKLNPRHQIYLTPPKTLARSVKPYWQRTQLELPETFVAILPNGRAWASSTDSAIITSDNFLLADVSRSKEANLLTLPGLCVSQKHPILTLVNLPPVHYIEGTVVVLPGIVDTNYFHWMIDILPSIGLLYCSQLNIAGVDKFLISSNCDLPFQRETLNILGIPKTKILDSAKYPHIQAKRLLVPSFAGHLSWATKASCEFLISLFLTKKNISCSNKKERIYISRKTAKWRGVINEEEVSSFLNKFGFKSVTLDYMSVNEQALLFAAAEVVISPHGAGLTNTVFCSPGTKVIEIFPQNFVMPFFWVISNQVGLDYYYLIGEGIESDYLRNFIYNDDMKYEDILINIDSLLNIMKLAGLV